MAWTKQTAGRTTSGGAKPAQLSGCKRHRSSSTEILSSRSSSPLSPCPPSPELQPMTISKESNIRSHCLCDVCINIPESITSHLGTHKISFKCPARHEKEDHAAHSKPMLYFGKSVPACSTPAFVKGVCERASKSQTEAQHLAATIGEDTFQQKIIFISTHSKVTCGDLFVGKDKGGDDMAVLPKEFMDYLFAGCLQLFISGATMFMLSCGPLVTFPQSICSFKELLLECTSFFCAMVMTCLRLGDRLRPAYMITFGATCFISAVIKSFIVAFGVWVMIQGHNLGEVFTDLLNVSVKLPMHTDAYLFQVEEQMVSGMPNPSSSAIHVKGMHYSWYHTHCCPWGCPLPMSCPKCGSIHSWSPSKQGEDSSGAPGHISTCY
ncbi:hypothetical protein F5141DRAFT_1066096 [Pisolithus sp. B1]|nr:hypothetical protein F5141DRAFT_1066096 [Pisolithus sp. B1]